MSFKEGSAGLEVYPGGDLFEFSCSWGEKDDFEWSLPL